MSKAESLQWQDPTADSAIGLVDRDTFHRGKRRLSLQAGIDEAISGLKKAFAAGTITNAFYRMHVDPLRRQRRSMQKRGE